MVFVDSALRKAVVWAVLGVSCAALQASPGAEDCDGAVQFPGAVVAAGRLGADLCSGDLNGDGVSDIVAVFEGSGTVNSYVVSERGRMALVETYSIGPGVRTAALTHLNQDPHLDLVVGGTPDSALTVLFGLGDGRFVVDDVIIRAGVAPVWSVAAGDFNGDGVSDLAASGLGSFEISVLLGVGQGRFSEATQYPAALNTIDLAAFDANADGLDDLAGVSSTRGSVFVRLGHPDGTLTFAGAFSVLEAATCITSGDMDGDGILDLICGSSQKPFLAIYPGLGEGEYAAGFVPRLGSYEDVEDVATEDLNGDGRVDIIAVTHNGPTGIAVLHNESDLQFSEPAGAFVGGLARSVAVGRFGADDAIDVAAVITQGITLLTGNSDGTLQTGEQLQIGGDVRVMSAAVDPDGDGLVEVAVPASDLGSVTIFRERADGSLQPGQTLVTSSSPTQALFGDLDLDGLLDLMVLSPELGCVDIYKGTDASGYQWVSTAHFGVYVVRIACGDLDGDGVFEIVGACVFDDEVRVLTSSVAFDYAIASVVESPGAPRGVDLGDIDGDGQVDVAIAHAVSGDVGIRKGNGLLALGPEARISVGGAPQTVRVSHSVGCDTGRGVIVTIALSDEVMFIAEHGEGYVVSWVHATNSFPSPILVDDVNRDGCQDLIVGCSSRVNVFLARGAVPCHYERYDYALDGAVLGLAVSDLGADGQRDLILSVQPGLVDPGSLVVMREGAGK